MNPAAVIIIGCFGVLLGSTLGLLAAVVIIGWRLPGRETGDDHGTTASETQIAEGQYDPAAPFGFGTNRKESR